MGRPWLIRRGNVTRCLVACAGLALGFAGTCVAAEDPAIPPGFLGYPPYSGFAFEATHLLPPRHDNLTVLEVEDWTLDRGMLGTGHEPNRPTISVSDAELQGIPTQLVAQFKAMKAAANGDEAYRAGKDLPESIRLYIAAAVDFHLAHPVVVVREPGFTVAKPPSEGPMDSEQRASLDRAIARFQAALDLDDQAKKPRAVAAAYMLGRSYVLRGASDDLDKAENSFVLTRTLARSGMPDPNGLAVASFGEQARLRRAHGDLASAIGLYAEQATRGSVEGVASLKWVAQAMYKDPATAASIENQPLAQRLLIAYALEVNDNGRMTDFVYRPHEDDGIYYDLFDPKGIAPILDAAKKWSRDKIAYPDRLAALAFRAGDRAFAATLLDGQDTALAWWLRAKLLVADGKLAEAEGAYQKSMDASKASSDGVAISKTNQLFVCGELVQLKRARGNYTRSIEQQADCDRIEGGYLGRDVRTYLAERVLTTPELKQFVDAMSAEATKEGGGALLRSVLAHRLAREGHMPEAVAYTNAESGGFLSTGPMDTGLPIYKSEREMFQAYLQARDQAEHGASPVERASAWYRLALLTRSHYASIMGHGSRLATGKVPLKPEFPGASADEQARLIRNHPSPDEDSLPWYTAYDQAMEAAKLVPARSQAYAAMLCHAAHWMHQAPEVEGHDRVAAFKNAYSMYLKNGAYVTWGKTFGHECPDPDFGRAAQPAMIREGAGLRARIGRHLAVAIGALVLLVVGAGLLVWRVRRKRSAVAAS